MSAWTTGEERTLRKNYGRVSRLELAGMLPRHSPPAIQVRAHKLGLVRKNHQPRDITRKRRDSRVLETLIRYRIERHVTLGAVAERMGSERTTVTRMEREGDMRFSTVERWAKALGLRIAVVDGEGNILDLALDEGEATMDYPPAIPSVAAQPDG